MISYEVIKEALEEGNKREKISVLTQLEQTSNKEILEQIINSLDDKDIQVRGEAFSCLLSNENDISSVLKNGLVSEKKNIRAFCALILSNRNNIESIPELKKLLGDSSSMVRSCALGALGHLKAKNLHKEIREKLFDESLEVRKSAAQAIYEIGDTITAHDLMILGKSRDLELEKLLSKIKNN